MYAKLDTSTAPGLNALVADQALARLDPPPASPSTPDTVEHQPARLDGRGFDGRDGRPQIPNTATPAIRLSDLAAANAGVVALSANGSTVAIGQVAPAAGVPNGAAIQKELNGIGVTSKTEDRIQGAPWEFNDFLVANPSGGAKKRAYIPFDRATKKVAKAADELERATAARVAAEPHKATNPQAFAAAEASEKAAQADYDVAYKSAEQAGDNFEKYVRHQHKKGTWERLDPELKALSKERRDAVKMSRKEKRKNPTSPATQKAQADLSVIDGKISARKKVIDDGVTNLDLKPTKQARTTYRVTIDGETVRLRDRTSAYATSSADGLTVRGTSRPDMRKETDDRIDNSTNLSASEKKVVKGVSHNEGDFSKINMWDKKRVTWGFNQWAGGDRSSLTKTMRRIKTSEPKAFADRFQKYGIDVERNQLKVTVPGKGVFYGEDAAKIIQDDPKLSAVFVRAGMDRAIQDAQMDSAKTDVASMRNTEIEYTDAHGNTNKAFIKDVASSEEAVALLYDSYVHGGRGRANQLVRKALNGLDPADPNFVAKANAAIIKTADLDAGRSKTLRQQGLDSKPGSFK